MIAAALIVPASFICIYTVRLVVDMLVRILPTKVSERLFAPTPKETVGVIGVDPLNARQVLAIAFLVWFGRFLYHDARGWLRRRRRKKERRTGSDSNLENATPAAPGRVADGVGSGQTEVERG